MRSARFAAVFLATGALLALPAAAKEGVRATLDAPARLDAAPGTRIRIAWRLLDADGQPFGASGIYLRVSRCGHKPLIVPATAGRGRGSYSALVRIPKSGIRKVVVGLQGWMTITGGPTKRADAFFPFDPPLQRRCS